MDLRKNFWRNWTSRRISEENPGGISGGSSEEILEKKSLGIPGIPGRNSKGIFKAIPKEILEGIPYSLEEPRKELLEETQTESLWEGTLNKPLKNYDHNQNS